MSKAIKRMFAAGLAVGLLLSSAGVVAAVAVEPAGIAALLEKVRVKPHPRSVDVTLLRNQWVAGNPTGVALSARISRLAKEPLADEPRFDQGVATSAGEKVRRMRVVQTVGVGEESKLMQAAYAWLATRDPTALSEARRRALNLSGWSASGETGYPAHDQAARGITWALALTYDWLYAEFSQEERNRLLLAIASRLSQMLAANVPFGLDDGRQLDRNPYDSHLAVTIARVAVICTVLAGEAPQFDACYRNIVPRYVMRPIPWGTDDGGYSNGTLYAQWDVLFHHFIVWDLLKQSLGVDLWQTPWAQGYGRFIAYFLPPGTPRGAFGDGAEMNWRHVWATQAKAYAARVQSPLAVWYAHSQAEEELLHLALLLAPRRELAPNTSKFPGNTPNAIHIPSIGWVAMHSDLSDSARTSVYFKASPYGSHNHSHADQNSFVINARGRALAIDSGYYDYFGSPHSRGWYKQTRAHNAVTYDGGQGQTLDTMDAKGRITQFEDTATYDFVSGDARAAYGGGVLTRAMRSMIYLRPGTLLVFDSLGSDSARTWEWNIHALNQMKVSDSRNIEIEHEGVRLCVRMLAGPEVQFTQSDRFTVEPQGKYPNQWHGVFSTRDKSKEAEFIVALEVGCGGAPVSAQREATGWRVGAGGKNFRFDRSMGVSLLK